MTNHNLNTSKGFPQQLQFTQNSADFLTENKVEIGDRYEIGRSMYEVTNIVESRISDMNYNSSLSIIWNRVESRRIRTL